MWNNIRIALLVTIAILLTAICLYLTFFEEKPKQVNSDRFISTLTSNNIINTKFKKYIKVADEDTKKDSEGAEETKEEIKTNKHEDKKNADYLGSIEIPTIDVSDAIYKSKGDYYLSHDYKQKSYEPGEIYLDERTGDHLLINGALLNGHAVPDGTKFGNFKKLLDMEEQPKIIIWDEVTQQIVTYKMLFISLIDGGSSGIIMDFKNDELRMQYYKNLYSTSIKQWEEPKGKNSFLLLNSCSYIIEDGHYVVVAQREG